jgi:hypothetical protein
MIKKEGVNRREFLSKSFKSIVSAFVMNETHEVAEH